MNGVGCLNSQRSTAFHWLSFSGKSRCERIHFPYHGYIAVSLVGRIASGSSRSLLPLLVTHATWEHILSAFGCSLAQTELSVPFWFRPQVSKQGVPLPTNRATCCTHACICMGGSDVLCGPQSSGRSWRPS